jgi:hypothetical protein
MYTDLPEALLEMHYYHAFRMLVQDHFGREVLRILKPSTNRETYLGFDQGFARCDLPAAELHRQLRGAIASNASTVPAMYVGYFLQYKRPERVERRRKETPSEFTTPYYWFELSLKASKLTGISQHETLLRLKGIRNADVSYACPMLFTEDDLHREPNLEDVRVVPISTAPSGYLTAERHFVAFRTRDDPTPVWCSEPTAGGSLSLPEWFRSLRLELMGPSEPLKWLEEISQAVSVVQEKGESRHGLPRALTIAELGKILERRPADLADQVRQARRDTQRQRALDDPEQGI